MKYLDWLSSSLSCQEMLQQFPIYKYKKSHQQIILGQRILTNDSQLYIEREDVNNPIKPKGADFEVLKTIVY